MRKVKMEILVTGNWPPGALMVEAVKALPQEIQDIFELKIWDITKPDGLERKIALNVVRMPTMALNGRLVFESSLPAEEELIEAIHDSKIF